MQTVHGRFTYLPGQPMSGTITLEAQIGGNQLLRSTSADVAIHPRWSQDLADDGTFSLQVPPTDDPTVQPSGFTYLVIQEFVDGRRSFSISVPASGGPVDLVTVAPTLPVLASYQTVRSINTELPDVNGDIQLPPPPTRLELTLNTELVPPPVARDGQMQLWRIKTNGHQLTLDPELFNTGQLTMAFDTEKTTYLGATYDAVSGQWHVLGLASGY